MRSLFYKLDADRNPVPATAEEMRGLFDDHGSRVVAQSDFGDVLVSTVFLGIDHGFNNEGPPVLFETLVFGGHFDGEMRRYSAWAEASRGHLEMLKQVAKAREARQ